MESIKLQLKESLKKNILNALQNGVTLISVSTCASLDIINCYNSEFIAKIFSSILQELFCELPNNTEKVYVNNILNYSESALSDPVYTEIISLLCKKNNSVVIEPTNPEHTNEIINIISNAMKCAIYDNKSSINTTKIDEYNLCTKLTNYCIKHNISYDQLKEIVSSSFNGQVEIDDRVFYCPIIDLNQATNNDLTNGDLTFINLQSKYIEHVICTVLFLILKDYADFEYSTCTLERAPIIAELEGWFKGANFLFESVKENFDIIIASNFQCNVGFNNDYIQFYFDESGCKPNNSYYQALLTQQYKKSKYQVHTRNKLLQHVSDRIDATIDRHELFTRFSLSKAQFDYLNSIIKVKSEHTILSDYLYSCKLVHGKEIDKINDDVYCLFYNEKMNSKLINNMVERVYLCDVKPSESLSYIRSEDLYLIRKTSLLYQINMVCSIINHKLNKELDLSKINIEVECNYHTLTNVHKIFKNTLICALFQKLGTNWSFDIDIATKIENKMITKLYITIKV